MNITRTNFKQNYQFIIDALNSCDFVSIDFEMSGMQATSNLRNSALDSIQTRYWKHKINVDHFMPFQVGICGFKFIDQQQIEAYPFNFYIYPYKLNQFGSLQYMCQSSTLNFLAENKFDFDSLYYDGILSLSHFEQLHINKNYHIFKEKIDQLENLMNPDIEEFMIQNSIKFKQHFDKTNQPFIIDIQNIKQSWYKNFENFVTKKGFFVSYNRSQMIVNRFGRSKNTTQTQQSTDFKGITNFFDCLSEQKKPLIFHNGLYDLMHLYSKFYEPLPDLQEMFKQRIHQLFPHIYDTKYIISQSNLLSSLTDTKTDLRSSFESMYQIDSLPIIKLNENMNQYTLDVSEQFANSHEAGYDALMTGVVFSKSIHKIKDFNKNFFFDQHPFKNKLALASIKVPFDLEQTDDIYHDFNLSIFHVFNSSDDSPQTAIQKHFKNIGYGNINLYFLGEQKQNFIIFQKQQDSVNFEKILESKGGLIELHLNNNQKIYIQKYQDYLMQIQKDVHQQLSYKKQPQIFEHLG